MRKTLLALLATTVIACMGVMLVGCGGGQSSNYDSQDLVWSNTNGDTYELVTTSDEVAWDEQKQRDVLYVYADLKNLMKENGDPKGTLNLMAFQGEKSLNYATVGSSKEDAEYFITTNSAELGAGESKSIVLAFYLENDSDVTVRFSSYTVADPVNGKDFIEVTYPVANRLSDGMKAVLEAQNAGTYSCETFEVKVLDGWTISKSDSNSVSLDNKSSSTFISISTASQPLKDVVAFKEKAFKTKAKTTTIGKMKWEMVKVNDTQFFLFAENTGGNSSTQVQVLGTHKNADKQIEEIVLK